MATDELPAEFFKRTDETDDALFYTQPRFVTHIDDATIGALTDFYQEFIPSEADVLDLMSSWVSHLPADKPYGRVAGLGMNEAELAGNPQLTEYCVHDLNASPQLPYTTDSFDRVAIAVSIQYLTRPIEVMASIHDCLRSNGQLCIAMSHRLFPTKAIAVFHQASRDQRAQLVGHYLQTAGFENIQFIDRSPSGADPLWLVIGDKSA